MERMTAAAARAAYEGEAATCVRLAHDSNGAATAISGDGPRALHCMLFSWDVMAGTLALWLEDGPDEWSFYRAGFPVFEESWAQWAEDVRNVLEVWANVSAN